MWIIECVIWPSLVPILKDNSIFSSAALSPGSRGEPRFRPTLRNGTKPHPNCQKNAKRTFEVVT